MYFLRNLEDKKENYPIEILELTADLLMTSLEKILKYIEAEESKEVSDMSAVEDLRVCLKMNLFLMFFFLRNTRIKRGKNSLKDEINEAAQIQHSKNDKKKTKTAVPIFFFIKN